MLHKILLTSTTFILIWGFVLIRFNHIQVLYIVFDVLLLAAGHEFPSGS